MPKTGLAKLVSAQSVPVRSEILLRLRLLLTPKTGIVSYHELPRKVRVTAGSIDTTTTYIPHNSYD